MKKKVIVFICLLAIGTIIYVTIDFARNKKVENNIVKEKSTEKIIELESYIENEDVLYKYTLFDSERNIAHQEENIYKEPHIEELDNGIIKISINAGTAVNMVRYYDSENNRISNVYESPRDEYDNKLIRVGDKKIIIQDIFDEVVYYKEIHLNTSDTAVPNNVIKSAKFLDEKTVEVIYLTGDDFIEETAIFEY